MRNPCSRQIAFTPAASGWRLAVVALALIAFAFQSYVTQTHIHGAYITPDAAKIAKQQDHDKYPAKDDPANCPICQEILHAGHYLTPGAAALALPSENVAVIPLRITVTFIVEAVSHDWRGRAPPRA